MEGLLPSKRAGSLPDGSDGGEDGPPEGLELRARKLVGVGTSKVEVIQPAPIKLVETLRTMLRRSDEADDVANLG
jgi:hypothetical protein